MPKKAQVGGGMTARCKMLTLQDISAYFAKPLHQASMLLGVCEQDLRLRCRQLEVMRWPYRRRKQTGETSSVGNMFFKFPWSQEKEKRADVHHNVEEEEEVKECKNYMVNQAVVSPLVTEDVQFLSVEELTAQHVLSPMESMEFQRADSPPPSHLISAVTSKPSSPLSGLSMDQDDSLEDDLDDEGNQGDTFQNVPLGCVIPTETKRPLPKLPTLQLMIEALAKLINNE